MTPNTRALIAHELEPDNGFQLIPAPPTRLWMTQPPGRFANRCLPIRLANQSGWLVLNNATLRCRWTGNEGLDQVTIDYGGSAPRYRATSHFGSGIITWNLPYLFRTPIGYNLLVRGPANVIKDGVAPLEGLVETDWTPATFTMNWKLTRPEAWVTFHREEPLCMLLPQPRGDLERFCPQIQPYGQDVELHSSHQRWAASRAAFLVELDTLGSAASEVGWQQDYFRGRTHDGEAPTATDHQTTLQLQPFLRDRGSQNRQDGGS